MINKNMELNDLLKNYWEYILEQMPTFATYIGDHRYNSRLEDLSEAAINKQADHFKGLLDEAEKIDENLLTDNNKLNLHLIKKSISNQIMMHKFKTHYIPLDQMQGPHLDFPQIIEFHPFRTEKDVKDYISRLNAFPSQIDQVIDLLRKGIEYKMVAYKKVIENTIIQVETFSKFTPEQSPMFSPVTKIKEILHEKDLKEITDSIKESIESKVTPAYKKLFDYLSREYIDHCRVKEGVWALPEGKDMYSFYAEYHTTTNLSPEEIHNIGKSEVARINSEIKIIMEKVSFSGSIREFIDYVKNRKDLYPEKGNEILEGYREILTHMDKKLPDFFGHLPEAEYDVKEIEEYREQAAPAAYYYPPPQDFSRPGSFYANTYKPEQRPKFIMEALAYHEAVPGHHLQIAIMQEQKEMPDFRRYEGSTAFIEGWALYAEKLSKEMGFYQDVFSEYGRLTMEIWRAVRLVVDTGLHYYKWTRDEAIEYCKENSGEEAHEIEVEVDRYIAMPGQALAYKIGELRILDLRKKSIKTLGSEFDIRDFHDRLLEKGALPLYELESVMTDWMDR
ncbi:MAG: DUF885 domain-containing protein [Candidatus Brocadiales bacterium]|nr:DUF885 domain-containing protein [Candidatus Brocadiales bacterium]